MNVKPIPNSKQGDFSQYLKLLQKDTYTYEPIIQPKIDPE